VHAIRVHNMLFFLNLHNVLVCAVFSHYIQPNHVTDVHCYAHDFLNIQGGPKMYPPTG